MKKLKMPENERYIFIGKTLFFPKYNLLAIGDLHLGYDASLRNHGLDFPIHQLEEIKTELGNLIDYIKAKYGKIGEMRIVFLGDIRHRFGYIATEKEEIKKLISFLNKKNIDESKIIFIRGNHEKNDSNEKFIDYYIEKDIAFIHGHREFIELYDKNINLIVMAHLHPTVTFSDKMKIKSEKYKCFLFGRYHKKDFLILPSFLNITEGISLSEFDDEKSGGYDFSIIPNKELENFKVYACQEIGEEALEFGKLKDIQKTADSI